MSAAYQAVNWMPTKRAYDLVMVASIAAYLAVFVAVGKIVWADDRSVSDPILLLRAFGTLAFLLLHLVLCIGPLARLDNRFLPLLFNRRHLGVATFIVGLFHGLLVVGWYHGFGNVNPLESLLTSNTQYASLTAFPFEILGVFALFILFLMAATSHDFWLHNLSPVVWKRLHMLVYVAYALLVLHVALGALQSERSNVYPVMTAVGLFVVAALHIAAGQREVRRDRCVAATSREANDATWLDVAGVDELVEGRGKTVCLPGAGLRGKAERVALFCHGGQISALSNACVHQGGPLGEGRIVDGCVVCPWHGYTYQPHNGQSPPPFKERVPTYHVKVVGGRIYVDPRALPAGTAVPPAPIEEKT